MIRITTLEKVTDCNDRRNWIILFNRYNL